MLQTKVFYIMKVIANIEVQFTIDEGKLVIVLQIFIYS